MRSLHLLLICLPLTFCPQAGADDGPGPNSADEPRVEVASAERAAAFLDRVALDWTRNRQCGTCHTNYPYLFARPTVPTEAAGPLAEIRDFFEKRVSHWDDPQPKAKPRWDAEVVATAASLALHDAASGGPLRPITRQALDRMWTLQRPDGSWEWLKCDWPPYEHDDDYGAAFAAVGVAFAPDDYRLTPDAREGTAKLVRYLHNTPAPSLHHRAMRLWAASRIEGIQDADQKADPIRALKELQRPDGGWSLASLGDWTRHDGTANDRNAPGDGLGTGFVIVVLRSASLPTTDDAVRRGLDWITSNQRVSGRWFTPSPSRDGTHYLTHAGTAYCLMALDACKTNGPVDSSRVP